MDHFLPASKLVVYAAKSAVKPISKAIVNRTKNNVHFIKGCEKVAYANQQFYQKIGHWSGNIIPKSVRELKPLTPVEAVEFCADLLGELIIFGFGLTFIIYEYRKSNAHKEKSIKADEQLANRINAMEAKLDQIVKHSHCQSPTQSSTQSSTQSPACSQKT